MLKDKDSLPDDDCCGNTTATFTIPTKEWEAIYRQAEKRTKHHECQHAHLLSVFFLDTGRSIHTWFEADFSRKDGRLKSLVLHKALLGNAHKMSSA